MSTPIDTATGLQSGGEVHTGLTRELVGYLIQFPDGFRCRLAPDRTRAELYAATHHARLFPMYIDIEA